MEDALEELVVALAIDAEDLERGPRVHRRVGIAEGPLVRGQLAVRVLIPLAQQQQELSLREVTVDLRERDAVECEVPRGEPRVLPGVGHREHVEAVEVPPVLVAAIQPLGRGRRHRRVADEPPVDIEVEELLRPQHPCERLPQHPCLVFGRAVRREPFVERVRLGATFVQDLVRGLLFAAGARAEREPHLSGFAGSDREAISRRHLRADTVGVDGRRAVDHVIVDAVLRIRGTRQPQSRVVLVSLSQNRSSGSPSSSST